MNWTRNLPEEGKMKQLGIEWTICKEGVPLEEINWKLSLERQARAGKEVNDDWVIKMAEDSKNGAEFPMPILQREKGQYIIYSGIHRCSMANLRDETEVPCYLVKITDDRLIDIFPRAINTTNGQPESRESVITHAKYIVEKHGYPVDQVAKWMGLRPEWLSVEVRAGKVENKLNEIGLKVSLPKTTLVALSPLSGNSNVLKAVVKLIKARDLAGDRAKQVIDDAKKGQTEASQMAEIARWSKILEDTEVKKVSVNGKAPTERRQNRGVFIGLVTRLERFLEKIQTCSQLQLDDTDATIAAKSWERIEKKMESFLKGVPSK